MEIDLLVKGENEYKYIIDEPVECSVGTMNSNTDLFLDWESFCNLTLPIIFNGTDTTTPTSETEDVEEEEEEEEKPIKEQIQEIIKNETSAINPGPVPVTNETNESNKTSTDNATSVNNSTISKDKTTRIIERLVSPVRVGPLE